MKDKTKLIIWDFSRTLIFPKNYKGGLNDLYQKNIDNKFSDYFYINIELFRFIQDINSDVPSIIFTTGYIQDNPEIASVLSETFGGVENIDSVGFEKSDPRSFKKICEIYNVQPSEVLYIDDQEKNIEAANQLGIRAMQYKNNNVEIIRFVKQNLT